MMKTIINKALAALGALKCPKCDSSRIEVTRVERPFGQSDGFHGTVFTCKECGNKWLEKAGPII